MKQQNRALSKRWFALVLIGLFIATCVITLLPWRIMAESPDTDEGIPDVSTTIRPVDSATGELVFDPQPTCLEDVQAAIDKYNTAIESESTGAENNSQKPRWQDEVDASFIPEGYSCQLVEDDGSFAATYYTFFIVEEESSKAEEASSYIAPRSADLGVQAAALGYGIGGYKVAPPGGEAVTNYFNIINGQVDTTYKNVAIITEDVINDYGAMWSKQRLDLTEPFATEIYLYIDHKDGTNDTVADGMTFTMHNDSLGMSAIGGLGEGLGVYKGRKSAGTNADGTPKTVEDGRLLNNMLAIEFDTYYNAQSNGSFVQDPTTYNTSTPYHCAVIESYKVSDKTKISAANHQNDFQISVADVWKQFKASWQPNATKTGGTLTYSYDGVEKTYTVASNQTTFGGNKVYWGFTGTTGGIASLQAAAIVSLPIPNVTVTKSVYSSSNANLNGGIANEGDTLTYKVRTYVNQGEKLSPITITDELSEYVDYAGGDVLVTTSSASNPSFYVTPSFDEKVMTVETSHELTAVGDWIEITFYVIVKQGAGGNVVTNEAEVSAGNLNPQKSNETRVTIASNLVFYKLGENDEPLAGASFELYKCTTNHTHGANCVWSAASLYKSAQQSGASGAVTFAGVDPGQYILVEKSAPKGYVTPSATSYVLVTMTSTGVSNMVGYGEFAQGSKIVGKDAEPNENYYKIHNQVATVFIEVEKVIGNFNSQSSDVRSKLLQIPFTIRLEGSFPATITLKHRHLSGGITAAASDTSIIIVSEAVPMEFSETYTVTAAITHSDGTQENQTSNIIIVEPGDYVFITVTNIFLPQPFFKVSDWITNLFG